MKSIVIYTILFLINVNALFSQNRKPQYYNEKNIQISKQNFVNADESYYFKKLFKNDSLIAGKLFYRKKKGQLTIEKKDSLFYLLEKSIDVKLDKTKALIFHHYRKSCKTINEEMSNRKYLNYIKKYPSALNYFVTEKGFNVKIERVKEDTLNIISTSFTDDNIDDTNYVIIKPNGIFYIIYGKYNLMYILDYAY